MTPRVSVLLPVRDGAATLAAALRSVLRQSEGRFECVVVDDGSRDESLALARDFARRDARIRVLATARSGLVATLMHGLAACTAPFVARMDADDCMHRERLRLQVAALEKTGLAAVGCWVRLHPRRGLSDGMRAYEHWLNAIDTPEAVRREAFVECPIAHPTLLARRSVLSAFGYRDADWPEDYDLVLRMLAAGERIGMVPRRLLLWRDGPGRLSRTSPVYASDRFTRCRAAFLATGPLAAASEYVLWGYGGTGRALRAALLEHGKRPVRIVELHPGRLGQRIHGAAVVAPAALAGGCELPIVVSVAGAGPRAEIRSALAAMGYAEGRDFVCAA